MVSESMPQTSILLLFSVSRVFFKTAKPTMIINRDMGILMKNMYFQLAAPKRSSMALPADAPNTFAMPYTPPTRPSAMPRFSGGKVVPNSAVAIGTMPPPPMA